ncbi:receptor expression-enhancing protein 4-like [Trifolium pratense]|uniref:receptor expression-enhancing protein 4-like n=1 Tax=Trifolium pratense TaxID=57577 RepID=UPI001E6982D7|nr:receptor expression-enhancing protein 4-like [Trifolium pratense]
MASLWFLNLLFICFHHFTWLVVALLYPMRASIKAIETDSYEETKHLISYWILLSLIYLFDFALMSLIPWFHLWPYIKLMIVFWLIRPDFRRASYVYNNLMRIMKPQIVTCWRKCFVEKDNFLMHAERYMKENGTEALEKLIASKTNGERFQTEHKDIKDLEAIVKREIPATKQMTYANIEASRKVSSAIVETKGILGRDPAGGEIPRSSTQKDVQKEWICALCLVKTSSEITLNSHLNGRRHREACEAASATLKAKKQPASQKNVLPEPFRMINSKLICKVCNVMLPSEECMASHIKGVKHLSNMKS